MLLQSCKIYIEGDRKDMERVDNVICSFAEESKVSDDNKHITSHQMLNQMLKPGGGHGGGINERPGTDHETLGPMRGLKKVPRGPSW